MPPQVALALGVMLSAALLILDMNRIRPTSRGMIIPVLWLMYTASKSLTFWFTASVAASTAEFKQGSPLDRTFLMALIGSGIFLLANRRIDWSRFVKENRWVIALFGWMLITTTWSRFPIVSSKRWIRSVGDAVMTIVVLSEEDRIEAIRLLIRRSAAVLLPMSLVLVKYYRRLGVHYDYTGTLELWAGVTTDKNTLGLVCAFSIAFLVWDLLIYRDRRDYLIDFVLLLFAMFLLTGSKSSRSMTSVAVAAIGSGLVVAFRLAPKSFRGVSVGGFSVAGVMIVVPLLTTFALRIPFFANLVGLIGRDPTFTGRIFLWDYLLEIASRHRLLGVGYGGFWVGNAYDVWTLFAWGPTQGHNGYIDLHLELGLVGVAILVCLVFTVFRNGTRAIAFDYAAGVLLMVFLIMALAHNATESSFLRGTQYVWNVFLLCCLQRAPREAETRDVEVHA